MIIIHKRKQHAVGQGFFHTGEIFPWSDNPIRYVYDCGSEPEYATQRDNRIDDYIGSLGTEKTIDYLFISHTHRDHMNGVERLLDQSKGVRVDTIILPLLDARERLLAYAADMSKEQQPPSDTFYIEYIIDPEKSLKVFGSRRIIFVKHNDSGSGAPSVPENEPNGTDNHVVNDREDHSKTKQKFVGEGDQPDDSAGTYEMPDSVAIFCAESASSLSAWILAPYVDPTIAAKRDRFMQNLSAKRKMEVPDLEGKLSSTEFISKLVHDHAKDLREAYEELGTKETVNISSLCLYSGPWWNAKNTHWCICRTVGRQHLVPDFGNVAWLGTGDAGLKTTSRRESFVEHYKAHLPKVGTLTIPHHGSAENFSEDLLAQVNPDISVIAAAAYRGWYHPATSVVQSIASSGGIQATVTSDPKSEVEEYVCMCQNCSSPSDARCMRPLYRDLWCCNVCTL